ncbi:hypothetical protein C8R43DRAFT_944207 [Mycena crocata]|nr:hypothetical protein C8R43DRAFT_944207 [Mycena crocata]
MTCSWPQRCSGWCFLQCCALDTYIFPSFANATLRYDPEAVWNGFINEEFDLFSYLGTNISSKHTRAIGTNVLQWALLNITLFLFPYVAAFLSIHPSVRAPILQDWQYIYAYAYFSSWMASTLVLIVLLLPIGSDWARTLLRVQRSNSQFGTRDLAGGEARQQTGTNHGSGGTDNTTTFASRRSGQKR